MIELFWFAISSHLLSPPPFFFFSHNGHSVKPALSTLLKLTLKARVQTYPRTFREIEMFAQFVNAVVNDLQDHYLCLTTHKGQFRRVGVVQNRFENTTRKRGTTAPSAPPLNPPMIPLALAAPSLLFAAASFLRERV